MKRIKDGAMQLGEGPVWDWRSHRLYYVDITEKMIWYYDSSSKTNMAIAEKLGFGSSQYFSRFFRLQTGMTPCEYRTTSEIPQTLKGDIIEKYIQTQGKQFIRYLKGIAVFLLDVYKCYEKNRIRRYYDE